MDLGQASDDELLAAASREAEAFGVFYRRSELPARPDRGARAAAARSGTARRRRAVVAAAVAAGALLVVSGASAVTGVGPVGDALRSKRWRGVTCGTELTRRVARRGLWLHCGSGTRAPGRDDLHDRCT